MSDEKRERILSKIRKCLMLAESPNPNEAAAALRQAQKLMELHNVDMAAVEKVEIHESYARSRFSVSRPKQWEVALIAGICMAFGCRFYFTAGHRRDTDVFGRYVFVGTREQVVVAEWTAETLFDRHFKRRKEHYKQISDPRYYRLRPEEISHRLDSFSIGWVTAVVIKVDQLANPENVERAINERMSEFDGAQTLKTQKTDSVARDAFYDGNVLGQQESIYRPMGSNGDVPQSLESQNDGH